MSFGERFRPPAAAVADVAETGVTQRWSVVPVIALGVATLVHLALVVRVDLKWWAVSGHDADLPLVLVSSAVVQAFLMLGVALMAWRGDRGRFAFLAAWGMLYLHRFEAHAARLGYMGKWPFVLALVIATLGWLVIRRRRRAIARAAVAATAT